MTQTQLAPGLIMEVTPQQQAYYDLPLWERYMNARYWWEQAHANYARGDGSNADFIRLRNAESVKDDLLAQLRQTPEHLAAFGW